MKMLRILILTRYMLLIFMGLVASFTVAEAKDFKPAFAMRFEKKMAYKARPNNVITLKHVVHKAESKKPAFAERFEMKSAYKARSNNVIMLKHRAGKTLTLKDHFDMKRAYKKEPVSIIAASQRN